MSGLVTHITSQIQVHLSNKEFSLGSRAWRFTDKGWPVISSEPPPPNKQTRAQWQLSQPPPVVRMICPRLLFLHHAQQLPGDEPLSRHLLTISQSETHHSWHSSVLRSSEHSKSRFHPSVFHHSNSVGTLQMQLPISCSNV